MATKIRLARHGKKKHPFYHIVIADGRAPRDGRYIEKIGTYNPITNPATIILDFDKALDWLQKGAVPSATARAILSYEGVMMKKHLLDGVKKGAFDEATADTRFKAWKDEQYARISSKRSLLSREKDKALNEKLEAEAKVKDARAEVIAKKRAEQAESMKAEEAAEEDGEATPEAIVETAPETIAEATAENSAEATAENTDTPAAENNEQA